MPRVLRIIARLNIGGPARQVCYLHRAMGEHGFEEQLVYGRLDAGEGDLGGEVAGSPRARFLPALVRPVRPVLDVFAALQIFFHLRRLEPDVVHTHTAKAGLLGRLAAILYNGLLPRARRAVLVHTYHGHVFEGYFSPAFTACIKAAERWLWHRSDAIITLTPGLGNEIAGHLGLGPEKLRIVPLGLDLEPLLAVERRDVFSRRFGVSREIWIGWVGRLVDIKNPGRFLRIAADLAARLSGRAGFVIVGDGPLRPALEREARNLGLIDLHFCGWSRDLVEIYSGLDFFLNTSDNEGTPVAVLEALAAGVPVAAAAVGGTREALASLPASSSGVWLFSPENWSANLDEWAAHLAKPRRLPLELRREVADRHSQQRLARDLAGLYAELLLKQSNGNQMQYRKDFSTENTD